MITKPLASVLRIVIGAAVAIAPLPLRAEPPDAKGDETRAEWPEQAPYNAAIEAFDATLTRAGWDAEFRKELIASPDSAKKAVAREGKINIPESKIIIFYEAQPPKVEPPKSSTSPGKSSTSPKEATPRARRSTSSSTEDVHVFFLPPFNKDDRTKKYKYEDYFMCCYDYWRSER